MPIDTVTKAQLITILQKNFDDLKSDICIKVMSIMEVKVSDSKQCNWSPSVMFKLYSGMAYEASDELRSVIEEAQLRYRISD